MVLSKAKEQLYLTQENASLSSCDKNQTTVHTRQYFSVRV